MEELAISQFKAQCLAVIERVRTTGRPVLITKRGVAVARQLPPPCTTIGKATFGCMQGTAEEIGDITEPLDESQWEALR